MHLGRIMILVVLGAAFVAGSFAGRVFVIVATDSAPPTSIDSAAHENVQLIVPARQVFERGTNVPPRVVTDLTDPLGRPVTISCASCHGNLQPNTARRDADEPPMIFHTGLTYRHGDLSCLSCHSPDNYNYLRLADGSALDFSAVMTLCSQCHAPQARDYAQGVHGGMTGYWDVTRGPQERKSCIDCHDPHAPQYPAMTPTFKPIDRFLLPPEQH